MRAPENNKLSSPFLGLVFRGINLQLMTFVTTLIALILTTYAQDKGWFSEHMAMFITTVFGLIVHTQYEYRVFWKVGERDRNLVLYHHLEETRFRGWKAGILASVPMLAAAAFYMLDCWYGILGTGGLLLCRMYGIQYLWFFQMAAEHPAGAWLLLLTPLCTAACIGIGYHNGYRLFEILPRILYKQKKTKS